MAEGFAPGEVEVECGGEFGVLFIGHFEVAAIVLAFEGHFTCPEFGGAEYFPVIGEFSVFGVTECPEGVGDVGELFEFKAFDVVFAFAEDFGEVETDDEVFIEEALTGGMGS